MNGGPQSDFAYLDPGSGRMLLGLVAPLFILGVVELTIWALVDAIQRNQTGWWVGMLVGWRFGLAWLVALIYRYDPPRAATIRHIDDGAGGH